MKRINASQMNVDSLYSPLSEMVEMVCVGGRSLEQWYYVTAGLWSPNRRTVPLTLRPTVNVTDPDTGRAYTPTLTGSLWYYRTHGASSWTQITNTTESADAPFTKKSNHDLVVRANFTAEIRCDLVYADPRNGLSVNTTVYATIITNEDSDSVYNVHITTDAEGYEFSPLTEDSSLKTLHAHATLGESNVSSQVLFQWYTLQNGQETLIGTDDPAYVSGQGTATLTINALFAEKFPVILRMKRNSNADLEPCRDHIAIVWRIPNVSGEVYSPQGAAVKPDTGGQMEFLPIYHTSQGTLPDQKVRENLRIKWSRRNSAGAFSTVGWGFNNLQQVNDLRTNGQTSTLMQAEAYLRGPYRQVVSGNKGVTITIDGTTYNVVEREIEDE